MSEVKVEFEGQGIYITSASGRLAYVYPASPGAYWADIETANHDFDTIVLIHDDFGNMVDGFSGAKQRAIFRKALH